MKIRFAIEVSEVEKNAAVCMVEKINNLFIGCPSKKEEVKDTITKMVNDAGEIEASVTDEGKKIGFEANLKENFVLNVCDWLTGVVSAFGGVVMNTINGYSMLCRMAGETKTFVNGEEVKTEKLHCVGMNKDGVQVNCRYKASDEEAEKKEEEILNKIDKGFGENSAE